VTARRLTRWRRATLFLVAVLTMAAAGGCGIDADGAPREIPQNRLPDAVVTTSTLP